MTFLKLKTSATRSIRYHIGCVVLSSSLLSLPAHADTSAKPVLATPDYVLEQPTYEIDDTASLEGYYLAAYVATLHKDMRAASIYYQHILDQMQEKAKKQGRKTSKKNTKQQLDDDFSANLPEFRARAFLSTLAEGDLTKSFEIANAMVNSKDNDINIAKFALTVRDIKQKNYKRAQVFLKTGISTPKVDLASVLLMAWTYAGAKNLTKVEETLNRIETRSPFAVVRDYHLGLINGMSGKKNEAVLHLQKAYRVDHSALKVVDAYARALSQQGNVSRAIEVYERFDRQAPNHPMVADALKKLRAGDVLAPSVTNAQEGAAEVLYALGAAGSRQNGGELPSILYLRLALYLEPKDALSTLAIADIFRRTQQYDMAISEFSQVPESSPLRAESEIEIGYSLANAKRNEEAVNYFSKLVEKRPDDVQALTALGDVLRSEKKWAESIGAYSKAIEKIGTPEMKHWLLFFNRGTAYERNNEWGKAEADLEKALQLVPSSYALGRASILNYLGYSWVDRRENIDIAFKMLQEAITLSPKDGAIIDSLGWAYYQLGRYDEAVRELERAIAIEARPGESKSGDPVINDHLGDAYWKVGRENEARFQWQHALDAEPEPEERIKIEKKLKEGLNNAVDQQPKKGNTSNPSPLSPLDNSANESTEPNKEEQKEVIE